MRDYYLNERELAELRSAHREVREIREAYRLNAVILLGQGWGVNDVADALLMDPDTVRSYFKRYKHGGVQPVARACYAAKGWQKSASLAAYPGCSRADSRWIRN